MSAQMTHRTMCLLGSVCLATTDHKNARAFSENKFTWCYVNLAYLVKNLLRISKREHSMYHINQTEFFSTTGCDFQSETGIRFRKIAVKSLHMIIDDILQRSDSSRAIAHKIKGIALSCGALEIARICLKLENYHQIINENAAQKILKDVAISMIELCDV